MNESEIIERAEVLPDRFADRLPAQTLDSLRLMEIGGEYGELTIELAASLAARMCLSLLRNVTSWRHFLPLRACPPTRSHS